MQQSFYSTMDSSAGTLAGANIQARRAEAPTTTAGHKRRSPSSDEGSAGKRARIQHPGDPLPRSAAGGLKRRSQSPNKPGGAKKACREPPPPPTITIDDSQDDKSQASVTARSSVVRNGVNGNGNGNGFRRTPSATRRQGGGDNGLKTDEFHRVENIVSSADYGKLLKAPAREMKHVEVQQTMPGAFPMDEEGDIQEVEAKPVNGKGGPQKPAVARRSPVKAMNGKQEMESDGSPDELAAAMQPRTLPTAAAAKLRGVRRDAKAQRPKAASAASHGIASSRAYGQLDADRLQYFNDLRRSSATGSGPELLPEVADVEAVIKAPVRQAIFRDTLLSEENMVIAIADDLNVHLFRKGSSPIHVLDLRSIIRITFHMQKQQLYLRLLTSQKGKQDPLCDLEFYGERDYMEFIRWATEAADVKPLKKDPNYLESVVAKRVEAIQSQKSVSRLSVNAPVSDEPIFPITKHRLEGPSAPKGSAPQGVGQRAGRVAAPTYKGTARPTRQDSNGHSEHVPGDIDRILQGVNDPHKTGNRIDELARGNRRNTRSSASFQVPTTFADDENPVALIEEFDGFDEAERYSRKHGLGKPWKHSLVYPRTGRRKATVDFVDLERLDENQFLNDNLIDFYLKYLQHEMDPEEAKRVYVCNTHFFTKLNETQQGQKINYEGVKRWTRDVDIFDREYVVVPINESAHWYVAIICNLPLLARKPPNLDDDPKDGDGNASKDKQDATVQTQGDDDDVVEIPLPLEESSPVGIATETQAQGSTRASQIIDSILGDEGAELDIWEDETADPPKQEPLQETKPLEKPAPPSSPSSSKKSRHISHRIDPDEPAIITLDSLDQPHPATISALRAWLVEEAKAKRGGMAVDPKEIRGMTAKGIPQQQNFSDCGVYLLGYLDKFVEDPRDFAARMLQRRFDAVEDWPRLVPGDMRAQVRELLQRLHEEQENGKRELKKSKGSLPRASDGRSPLKAEVPPAAKMEQAPVTADPPKDAEPEPEPEPEPALVESKPPPEPKTVEVEPDDRHAAAAKEIPLVDYADSSSPPGPVSMLEVPRTPEQSTPTAPIRPIQEPNHTVYDEVPVLERSASDEGDPSVDPPHHVITIPDSQENSFRSQLTEAIADSQEPTTQELEQAEVARVPPPTPPRPKTRGKLEVGGRAVDNSVPGASSARAAFRRSPQARQPLRKLEVIDVG